MGCAKEDTGWQDVEHARLLSELKARLDWECSTPRTSRLSKGNMTMVCGPGSVVTTDKFFPDVGDEVEMRRKMTRYVRSNLP